MSEVLEYALRYAQKGWKVVPLLGKSPEWLGKEWQAKASSDPRLIRSWWEANPSMNVGALTGHNFFVLDIDKRPGGYEQLDELLSKNGPLPNTLQASSGAGGRHYFFKLPLDFEVRHKKINTGVEIKGFHGAIALEPSIHPETKQRYIWDGLEEFEKQDILDAPDWLLSLIRADDKPKAPFVLPENGGKITTGSRNNFLHKYASSMRSRGHTPEEITDLLTLTNTKRCDPPLSLKEIDSIVGSVSHYAPSQLRDAGTLRKAYMEYEREIRAQYADPVIAAQVDANWRERTITKGNGAPKNLLANMDIALTSSPAFNSSLAFNEFTGEEVFIRQVLGKIEAGTPVGDREIREVQAHLQSVEYMEVTKDTVAEGIELVASRNSSHPIRNYLAGLEWDNEQRVDRWLTKYLGVGDSAYTRAVGRRWLISAVARVMQPGCKADCCLVLEGPQGTGKSTALRNLASGDWYSDTKIDFASKDGYIALRGVWLYEIGELDAYNKSEAGDIKRFMSAQVDKYRGVHARKDARWPRQCVFAATVNPEEYLKDKTGNRRFWPVRAAYVSPIDNDAILRDRDQLWAEAMTLYMDGAPWFLDDPDVVELAVSEQSKRMESDVWESVIEEYCETKHASHGFTTGEILRDALLKPMGQWTKGDEMRVASCLKSCGYTKVVQGSENGSRSRRYHLPQRGACEVSYTSEA